MFQRACGCAKVCRHGDLGEPISDLLPFGRNFAQADVCYLWIGKQGEGNLPTRGDAVAPAKLSHRIRKSSNALCVNCGLSLAALPCNRSRAGITAHAL